MPMQPADCLEVISYDGSVHWQGLCQLEARVLLSATFTSFDIFDASGDETADRVMQNGAIEVNYDLQTTGATNVDRVDLYAYIYGGSRKIGEFDGAALSGGILRLDNTIGLSGNKTITARAFDGNVQVASATDQIRFLGTQKFSGNFKANTWTYSGGDNSGRIYHGAGGTDTLELSVASSTVSSFNGTSLIDYNPINDIVNEQAIYQGKAYDYLTLSGGGEIYLSGIERLEFSDRTVELMVHPNDDRFAEQWNLMVTDIPDAWRFTRGSEDIVLMSLDTGLQTNSSGNFRFSDLDSSRFILEPFDRDGVHNGHGHKATSIMVAKANNDNGMRGHNSRIAGINWVGDVLVADVYSGVGLAAAIDEGLDYARLNGKKIVFQGGIQGAGWIGLNNGRIESASDVGLFAIAAGNGGGNMTDGGGLGGGVANLAAYEDHVISVGALQRSNQTVHGLRNASAVNRASYSNRGTGDVETANLSFAAPTDVLSVNGAGNVGNFNGTSAANPNMAALASLVWSINSDWTPDVIKQILTDTVMDIGSAGYDRNFGHGLPDAGAAVRRAWALTENEQLSTQDASSFGPKIGFNLLDNMVEAGVAGAEIGDISVWGNQGLGYTLSVSDSDFRIVDRTLKLKNSISLNSDRSIDITLTDSLGYSYSRSYTIQVPNTAPVITSEALVSVDENATGTVHQVTAIDAENDSLSYAIAGGDDASLFTIDSLTGEITFISQPDFENPLDANSDNSYVIEVVANDGDLDSATQTVTINVNNVAESTGDPKLFNDAITVSTSGWTTVNLQQSYDNMVIVGTPVHKSGQAPVVTRIQNIGSDHFQIKLQRADGLAGEVSTEVHLLVVEAGVYTLAENGINMEAGVITSGITANKQNWDQVDSISYNHDYTSNPVVLGQVMSYENTAFSTFFAQGETRADHPTSTTLKIGKHTGEDNSVRSNAEDLGYIVFEAASGQIEVANSNGVSLVEFYAVTGADTVAGIGNGAATYDNGAAVNSAILSSAGLDGGDGGWAVLYGEDPFDGTQINLAIDEDQYGDEERSHTTESVSYVAFGAAAGPKLFNHELDVSNTGWTTINLPHIYKEMVVVATPVHQSGNAPVVTRIQNIGPDSFQIKLQRADGLSAAMSTKVHLVVAEAGVYTKAEHGIKMEVGVITSSQTANKQNWNQVDTIAYQQSYTGTPVVLSQVMSYNNVGFSTFFAQGESISDHPTNTTLKIGKHTGEDYSLRSNDEELGYIVIQSDSGIVEVSGVNGVQLMQFNAVAGANMITGVDNGGGSYDNGSAVNSAILSIAGINGNNGGWAVLDGGDDDNPFDGTNINLSIDEDQMTDAERWHIQEMVSFLAFS